MIADICIERKPQGAATDNEEKGREAAISWYDAFFVAPLRSSISAQSIY